jgi:hypothetical protein
VSIFMDGVTCRERGRSRGDGDGRTRSGVVGEVARVHGGEHRKVAGGDTVCKRAEGGLELKYGSGE